MSQAFLGYQWLIHHFDLPQYPLPVSSFLGARISERQSDGRVVKVYTPQYAPGDTAIGHLEFALKYDGVHLAVLSATFRAMGPGPIERYLRMHPTSKYAKLLGFYYEFCTGNVIDPAIEAGGNYVLALDKDEYVTRKGTNIPRWRVTNNLLGGPAFCPIIRRVPDIPSDDDDRLQQEVSRLVADFPVELLERAADYLYLKETKSTYRIEHEEVPPHERKIRFLKMLQAAGRDDFASLLSEEGLTSCQHLIVDRRYAVDGFRDDQNYVGETLPHRERVHYICPPPEQLHELMTGLQSFALGSFDLHPILQAAVVSFGFVFMHPFDDGNGRLHRFLIHDVLQRRNVTPPGLLLPVSAVMLRDMRQYDACLESFSKPLVGDLAKFEVARNGALTFKNGASLADYYRFPDMTAIAVYLSKAVEKCIQEDFADELNILTSFDAARSCIQNIIDMPDRRMDMLMKFLHQNQGRLAKGRRRDFEEITDEELKSIEEGFRAIFWPAASPGPDQGATPPSP